MAHPKSLLDLLGANALKSFSQNFLTSPHWADKLADAAMAFDSDEVWEIGPGLGALTEKLVERSECPVRVFEIDRKLSGYLRQHFAEATEKGRFTLHEGDFMSVDVAAISAAPRITVLSNLPYHLSSPILFRLLEIKARIAGQVLTFQREFAERCAAKPGTKAYSSLTVALALHYRVESVGRIPPKAFYPAPDVESEALSFTPIAVDADTAKAIEIARFAFQQRRKTIAHSLKHNYDSSLVMAALQAAEIPPTIRPEQLAPADFLRLAAKFV